MTDDELINSVASTQLLAFKDLYKFHGMNDAEVKQAEEHFEMFIKKEKGRPGRRHFWHSPLGRHAFIMGFCYRQ